MVTTTSFKLLQVPTVNADTGLWGGYLNNTIGALDTIIGQYTALQSSLGNSFTPTSSQCQSAGFFTQGTFSGQITLTFLSSLGANGLYGIFNNSSLSMLIQGSSIGNNITLPANSTRLVVASGENVFFADPQSPLPLQTGIEFGMDGSSLPPQTGRKPGIVLPWSFTIQGWEIICADNGNSSISLNYESNFSTISGASSLGFTNADSNSGTSSSWGATSFSSGTFLSVTVNSASAGTKYTACLFGIRTT